MTLETIYYITQIVAVGAILVSLLAIWFQMRQSTKMERASAQRGLLDRVSDFTRSIGLEEGDHFILGMNDFDGASHETKIVVHNRLIEFVFITESALNMHQDGFFSEGTWAGIDGAMLGMLRTPGGQQFWDYAQHIVGFEIAKHINRRFEEFGTDDPNFLDAVPFYRPRLAALELEQDDSCTPFERAALNQMKSASDTDQK